MSYTSRTYEKVDGFFGPPHETAPVVVLVVEGHHDVSRLVQALHHGTCEQVGVGEKIVRQLKRRNSGRDALLLLKRHGGMDFTEDDAEDPVLAQRDALIEALQAFVDPDDPCVLDHHGYCQAHNDFSGDGCRHARALELCRAMEVKL